MSCDSGNDPRYCIRDYKEAACLKYVNVPYECPKLCRMCPCKFVSFYLLVIGCLLNLLCTHVFMLFVTKVCLYYKNLLHDGCKKSEHRWFHSSWNRNIWWSGMQQHLWMLDQNFTGALLLIKRMRFIGTSLFCRMAGMYVFLNYGWFSDVPWQCQRHVNFNNTYKGANKAQIIYYNVHSKFINETTLNFDRCMTISQENQPVNILMIQYYIWFTHQYPIVSYF